MLLTAGSPSLLPLGGDGPVQGHRVDCCWKGVPFAAVIAANQPLCQLNAERLQVNSRPAPSWPALPRQDEGVGNAAVYEEPKDVPVVSKSTCSAQKRGGEGRGGEELSYCLHV